jgi:hypothetical protein
MQCETPDAGAAVIDLHLDERGGITAVMDGKPIASPASAAEDVIRPFLINSFGA